MICPKCGFEQPEAAECQKCGVIVAKYRPREARPEAMPPLPSGAETEAPGWARGATPMPPGAGGGYSRFGAGVDQDAMRRVQAQAATKKFVLVLILAGIAGFIFVFTGTVFKIYGNRTKLELDTTSGASDLANMTPDGVREQIRRQAAGYGFTIKDDRIRISFSEVDGKPLSRMLLSSSGISFVTLKVLIEYTVETRALGIPLSFDIKASSTISTRIVLQELWRWAADEYGEGLVGTETELEREAETEEPEPVEAPEPGEPSDYVPDAGGY